MHIYFINNFFFKELNILHIIFVMFLVAINFILNFLTQFKLFFFLLICLGFTCDYPA